MDRDLQRLLAKVDRVVEKLTWISVVFIVGYLVVHIIVALARN